MVGRERFRACYIERRAAELSGAQSGKKVIRHNGGAAPRVKQNGAWLHQGKAASVHQSGCLRCLGKREDNRIGQWKQPVKILKGA